MGEMHSLSLLGSATCSVRNFVRTELRTVLAIASATAPTGAIQPIASRKEPTILLGQGEPFVPFGLKRKTREMQGAPCV
jgi:hypothetical protein